MNEKPDMKVLSAGERKVEEYIDRVESGENVENIIKDLPKVFSSAVLEGVEKRRQKNIDKIREDLGLETKEDSNLKNYVMEIAEKSPSQAAKALYMKLLQDIDNPVSRKQLVSALFNKAYDGYRNADYVSEKDEDEIWKYAQSSTKVKVDTRSPDWVYRGIFPDKGTKTETRGSFNVRVTKELIDSLDQLIIDGTIKANYKFGVPDTKTAPSERTDSISIYFLEEPSQEALQILSKIIKPFARGDNLLGQRISEGFYMSEIGSISSKDVVIFVEDLNKIDPALSEAVKGYVTPKINQGSSLKMSEAQYYAIRDICKLFDVELTYSKDSGFVTSTV